MVIRGTEAARARQGGPALEHPGRPVDRSGQVVPRPHPVEARFLGHDGGIADLLPSGAERVQEQVHSHEATLFPACLAAGRFALAQVAGSDLGQHEAAVRPPAPTPGAQPVASRWRRWLGAIWANASRRAAAGAESRTPRKGRGHGAGFRPAGAARGRGSRRRGSPAPAVRADGRWPRKRPRCPCRSDHGRVLTGQAGVQGADRLRHPCFLCRRSRTAGRRMEGPMPRRGRRPGPPRRRGADDWTAVYLSGLASGSPGRAVTTTPPAPRPSEPWPEPGGSGRRPCSPPR